MSQVTREYYAEISGGTVTLTPLNTDESHPAHLAISRIVCTTTNPAPTESWQTSGSSCAKYEVIIRRKT